MAAVVLGLPALRLLLLAYLVETLDERLPLAGRRSSLISKVASALRVGIAVLMVKFRSVSRFLELRDELLSAARVIQVKLTAQQTAA